MESPYGVDLSKYTKQYLQQLVENAILSIAIGVSYKAKLQSGRTIIVESDGEEIVRLTIFTNDHGPATRAHAHALIEFNQNLKPLENGYNLRVDLHTLMVLEDAKKDGVAVHIGDIPKEHITSAKYWVEVFKTPLRILWNITFTSMAVRDWYGE